MTNAQMATAFNEWMRRYIEEPEAYEAEFRTVNEFLAAEAGGQVPTYGEACSAYLEKLVAEAH